MRSAFALRIFSGKNILNFAFVALCGALQTPFHGRGRNGKRHLQRRFLRKRGAVVSILALSVTYGDSSPKGRALGSPRKRHLFAKASPFGRGGFAKQRRRGRGRLRGRYPLSLLTAFAASSPKGTPYGNAGNFAATAEAVPLRDDFPRSRGRCRVATKGGVWLDAKRQDGRGTSPIFSLPCNDPPRSTVCSTGKVSEFCPAAEGRKADRMPVLGRQSCAFRRF